MPDEKKYICDGRLCPFVGTEAEMIKHLEQFWYNEDGSLKEPDEVFHQGYWDLDGEGRKPAYWELVNKKDLGR